MDKGTVRMQAQMLAIQAEISAKLVEVEGMKAANTIREQQDRGLDYDETDFVLISHKILTLRVRLLEEI